MTELKRRKVIRVAVAYLIVGWLTAQVSATLFPFLNLAPATVTLVIALLIVGFPIALVLAWAYDLTPDGIERTPGRQQDTQALDPAAPAAPATTAGQAAAPAAKPMSRGEPRPIRAIVALPFANLTRDDEGELFSDGVTEELIGALARVPGLRVLGRTSTFALKGRAADIREIGEQLGVDAVVEGSVRVVGRKVRISVQLTDVLEGYQLWSQMYDRELADVLSLQEDIARRIVEALRLGGEVGDGRLLRTSTRDVDAYTLYLHGRLLWKKRTGPALHEAIESFYAAIAIDPDFALAHAGVADSLSILLDYGLVAPADALPRALAAAERAVALDAGLAEAHTALALVCQIGWDWGAAEAAFRRAIEIDADYGVAHHRYALLLSWLGRDDEAQHEIRRAQELDPFSHIVNATVGWVHYYGRRADDAVREYRRVLAMEPSFVNARLALGLALLQVDRAAEAVIELERAVELSAASTGILPLLGIARARAGRRADAQSVHESLNARAAHEFVSPYHLALAALGVGERAEALEWLQRAGAQRSPQLAYLKVDPLLDSLRAEPAFERLLQETGLGDSVLQARLAT